MTDAEALYRRILARPRTDPLRALELMYADAIEDADPARAELVRVQCQIERDPEVPLAHIVEEEAARLAAIHAQPLPALLAGVQKRQAAPLLFLQQVDCLVEDRQSKWRERTDELRDRERALLDENRDRWLAGPLSAALLTVAGWECGFPVVRAAEFEHCWRFEQMHGGRTLVPTGRMQSVARECHVAAVFAGNLAPQRRERVRTYWQWPYAPDGFPEWMRALSEDEFDSRGEADLALGRASVLAAIRWLDARKFDGAKP